MVHVGSDRILASFAAVAKHYGQSRGQDDLRAKVISALRRLQKLPNIVRGYFRDPNLAYITT